MDIKFPEVPDSDDNLLELFWDLDDYPRHGIVYLKGKKRGERYPRYLLDLDIKNWEVTLCVAPGHGENSVKKFKDLLVSED